MRRILTLAMIALLAACGTKEDNLNAILGAEKGHFQGVSIGDKHQKVLKKIAPQELTDNEAGTTCEYDVDNVSVTVTYEFDNEELYSIQADIFFEDSTALRNFEEGLIARYNESYGEMTENGGFFVWQENNQVEFTLADESIEFGQPKLSLTIYNFGY